MSDDLVERLRTYYQVGGKTEKLVSLAADRIEALQLGYEARGHLIEGLETKYVKQLERIDALKVALQEIEALEAAARRLIDAHDMGDLHGEAEGWLALRKASHYPRRALAENEDSSPATPATAATATPVRGGNRP